jgi:hypothetical protein
VVSDGRGIYLKEAENITIENNNASQNGCGIYLRETPAEIHWKIMK